MLTGGGRGGPGDTPGLASASFDDQASWASFVDEEAVIARRVRGLWARTTSSGAFAVRDSQNQSEACGPKSRREPGAAAYSGVCVCEGVGVLRRGAGEGAGGGGGHWNSLSKRRLWVGCVSFVN